MASTASDLLKLELQATGENPSTWGTKANTVFSRIEEAIAGYSEITLAGVNYTLDDTQYVENIGTTGESHLAIIKASGTPGATRQIIVPLRTKKYLIWNATTDSSDLTVGGATGDTVTIGNGLLAEVVCDGTNVEFASPLFTTAGVVDGASVTDFTVADESSDTTCFPLFVTAATGALAPKTGSNLTFNASTGLLNATILHSNSVLVASTGLQTAWIPAAGMRPTATAGCAALTDVETTAGRPDMTSLDFDATTQEYAQFGISFPKSWDEGTITYRVFWTSTAADTDGVSWSLQGLSVPDNTTIDAAYGTAITVDDANQSTAEEMLVTAVSGAVTISNAAADCMTFFRVSREVADTNDTATEDARLLGIQIFFSTDASNDT